MARQRAGTVLLDVQLRAQGRDWMGNSPCASLNSFSSSLGQGNLPLLKTVDAVSEKGGRRR
ncbi:hypothetical protein [Streptomyces sp. PSKA30]|uniref:hypothetical protein n=1 Tax=Streptomyces sp. PSKA30 TaxID=2874597 RepID=UPI001CD0E0BA|nr:hypothetical protein [Streptomyces sp. PSKA30]MBZ9642930.1 hypothetical protein [Streptomyces sp. PSKA30]